MWPRRSTSESEWISVKCSCSVHFGGVWGFYLSHILFDDVDWMLINYEGAPALAVRMFSCLQNQTRSCSPSLTWDVNQKYDSGCDQENHGKCTLLGQIEIFIVEALLAYYPIHVVMWKWDFLNARGIDNRSTFCIMHWLLQTISRHLLKLRFSAVVFISVYQWIEAF